MSSIAALSLSSLIDGGASSPSPEPSINSPSTSASEGDTINVPAEVDIPDDVHSALLVHEEAADSVRVHFSWRKLFLFSGPGWLMSIAYLDPGNLESDLQSGAYAGYQLLWVLFACTVAGLFFQVLACRLGVVTGKHLAQHCRQQYSTATRNLLWLMTELAIIGADIQEVIGSSIALRILFGVPLWAGCLITGFDTFTFLLLHHFGIRKLEALFAALISTMCVCFFIEFGYSSPPFSSVAGGFVPYVSSYAVVQAVGLVGCLLMPHNMYLHSALVQSRKIDRTVNYKIREANFYFAIEAAVALFISFFINLAVVVVFAHGFFDPKCAEERMALLNGECQTIGLAIADVALQDSLGSAASTVWAIGLLASGQASTMTGTYSAQYVTDGFLNLSMPPWKRVTITRAIALGPAILVSIFGSTSDHTSDTMGEWLNILQAIQLPFALLPLLHFTSSKRIMGQFVNGYRVQVVSWTLAFFLISANYYLIISFVMDDESPTPKASWFYVVVSLLMLLYTVFLFAIIRTDLRRFIHYVRTHYPALFGGGPGESLAINAEDGAKKNNKTFAEQPSTTESSDA